MANALGGLRARRSAPGQAALRSMQEARTRTVPACCTVRLRHSGCTCQHSGPPSSSGVSPLGVADALLKELYLRSSALDACQLPTT